MPRTVVYHSKSPAAALGVPDAEPAQKRSGVAATAPENLPASSAGAVDGYAEKLVKFVPAEVVAFFAPIAALVQDRPGLLLGSAALGLVATPAYLMAKARSLPEKARPPLYNYILSAVAFAAWALATSNLGGMIGLDSVSNGVVLAAAVFLIPLVDKLLSPRAATAP